MFITYGTGFAGHTETATQILHSLISQEFKLVVSCNVSDSHVDCYIENYCSRLRWTSVVNLKCFDCLSRYLVYLSNLCMLQDGRQSSHLAVVSFSSACFTGDPFVSSNGGARKFPIRCTFRTHNPKSKSRLDLRCRAPCCSH